MLSLLQSIPRSFSILLPLILLTVIHGTDQLQPPKDKEHNIHTNKTNHKDVSNVHQQRSMMRALGPRSKIEPKAQRVRGPMINMYDGYGGTNILPPYYRSETFQSFRVPPTQAIQKALKDAPKNINFLHLDHLAGLLSGLKPVIRNFKGVRQQIVEAILSRVEFGPLYDLISSYSLAKSGDSSFYSGLESLGRTNIPFEKIHRALSASSIRFESEMATTIKAFVSAFLGLDLEPSLKPLFDVELSKFLTLSVVSPATSNRLKSRVRSKEYSIIPYQLASYQSIVLHI